jgi:hypothetical membrane protein
MISAVITGHISGRVFTFLSTGVLWGVVHKNARVFYRDMHGTLSAKRNNFYMFLCIIAMVALPLAGIFDTLNHRPYHRPFVVLFFMSFGFYTVFIAKSICENRHLYPTCDQGKIDWINKNRDIFFWVHLIFGLLFAYYKHHGPVPYIEWVAVTDLLYFYVLVNTVNHHYDSTHEPYLKAEDRATRKLKSQ